jgi:hypothetical protein
MFTATSAREVELYRLIVIKHAIKLYLETGMKANRAFTPTAMREAVGQITGTTYPKSKKGLTAAFTDLVAHIENLSTWVNTNPEIIELRDPTYGKETR